MKTTVVYAPHPDDETLRLSAYITFARQRGDRMILVAVNDGGGTSLVGQWGWDIPQMQAHRIAEQTAAWHALAGPGAQIIRMGLQDGNVQARGGEITALAAKLEAQYAPEGGVEHYTACREDDVHPDHRTVALAVKAANVPVVRCALEPGTIGGTKYSPVNQAGVERAHRAYRTIGWNSTPTLFNHLKDQGYASFITR